MKWMILTITLIGIHLQATEPCSIFHNPNSILKNSASSPFYVVNRSRFATCADVAWFEDSRHLMLVNLLACSLSVCLFEENKMTLIKEIDVRKTFSIFNPEKCLFITGSDYLALTSKGAVSFFKVKDNNIFFNDKYPPIEFENTIVHGIAFSPSNKYLVCGLLDKGGSLVFFENKNGQYKKIRCIDQPVKGLKPKGILFSRDEKFMIVVFSQTAGTQKKQLKEACLIVYPFNPDSGLIDSKPVSMITWNGVIESLTFSPDCSFIYATDQSSDKVIRVEFNSSLGSLGKPQVVLQNPESKLSFPHGLAFSPDGKYLAVSNFGNDTVTIYRNDE